MLKQRIITALILAPVVLAAVFYLPPPYFAGFFFLLTALAATEWARLVPLGSLAERYLFYGLLSIIAATLYAVPAVAGVLLLVLLVFWCIAALCVLRYPRSRSLVENRSWMLGTGVLVLAGAWAALVVLRNETDGARLIVWALAVVWSADIGAYFAGRAFGRVKLAPAVSPGKTWEGAVGGGALSLAVGVLLALLLALPGPVGSWLLAAAVLTVVSVFGDLYESVVKRVHEVKDSGGLLPGHGGVLDRIDSLLAVLPIFALMATATAWW